MKRASILFGLVVYGIVFCLLAGCRAQEDVVTQAEFEEIQPGMSYAQVQTILGRRGEDITRGGQAGTFGTAIVTTKTYQWRNSDGSSMSATFLTDQLMEKTQEGLR